MRLAGQQKLGFYPISPVAVEGILKHLKLLDPDRDHRIIDPCAGEGAAIQQIAEGLGLHHDQVYAVELDKGRAAKIRENMPEANVIGPATFLGVHVTGHSFSLAYVNPPFDFEMGGGRREEQAFVQKATNLLALRGVLVLVMPCDKLCGNQKFVEYLDSYYEEIEVYKLPDGHRPYGEIVLIGRKRKVEIPAGSLYQHGVLHQRQWQWRTYVRAENMPSLGEKQPKNWYQGNPSYDRKEEIDVWALERGWKPGTFKKVSMTEDELIAALEDSPLKKHLMEVKPLPVARPPLPLDKGHLGLILASGMLDGVVNTPFGPHVVRGSSTKVEYRNNEASCSTMNPETGAVTTKTVFSEKPVTIIRCVTRGGELYTFSNTPPKDESEEDAA
jgi:predicted RNA methylase